MNIKPIRIYLVLMIVAIGLYAFSMWEGYAIYSDSVEKNTEYNRSHRVGYINRFYHK